MHNRALHDSLAAFVEEAAWQLAEEVSGGAEVPFELIEQGRASAPLYCYRPLTGRFLADRSTELAKLPSYAPAVQGLEGLPDLPAYLQERGRRTPSPDRRAQAEAALQAFLAAVWAESTDFTFDRERFDAAFAELEEAVYGDRTLSLVLAAVEGMVLESDEVQLGDGLALVRAETLEDAPGELRDDEMGTVAMLSLDAAAGDGRALEDAGRRLRRLQTALRLWDDAEPSLGPTAWARTGGERVERGAAGHRRPPRRRRLPARRRRGGPAARVLLARHPPHPARRRARMGAAPVRARLRARERRRGADRLAAGRPRPARRSRLARLRRRGRASRRHLRHSGRPPGARGAGSRRRSASSGPRSPGACAPIRRSRT